MPTTATPRAVLSGLTRRARGVADAGEKPLDALKSVIDAVPLAVLVADDHGRYVLSNAHAVRLTGYTERALRRLSVWDLTPGPANHDFEVLWRAFIQQREQHGRYELVTKTGRVVAAEYAARANVLPHLHVSVLRQSEPETRTKAAGRSGHVR